MPKKTSDLEPGTGITALFKGPPGSGKTVGAASFPGPIFVFDFDGRMRPVQKMFPDRKDVFYETFKPGKPGEFDRFMKVANGLEDRGDYVTGILDSLTSFGRCAVDYSLDVRRSEKDNKGMKIIGQSGIALPEWPEWRFEDRAVWQSLNHLRYRCGFKHFIMTAHLQEIERKKVAEAGQDEKIITYRRVVTGAQWLAAEIPAYFDEVWNFTASPGGKSGKFEVITVNLDEDSAKTALPLPKRIDFTAPLTLFGEVSRILAEQKIELEGAKK